MRLRNLLLGGCLATLAVTPVCAQSAKAKRESRRSASPSLPAGLQKAESAIQAQQYSVAEPLLLNEVKREPRDFRAWYDLGFIYQQTQRPQQALEAYKRSVAADATIARTFAALGALEHQLGMEQEATTHLRKATELEPKDFDLWMQLAEVQSQSTLRDAIASYAQAATLSPKDPDPHLRAAQLLLAAQDDAAALREFKAAAELGADDALTPLAALYQKSGQGPLAISTLRAYLTSHTDDAQAHEALGRLLKSQGDIPGATAELKAATTLDPKNIHALKALGGLQLEAKLLPEAEQSFRNALAVQPNDADAHYGLATALNSQHRFDAAEREFAVTVALDPDLVEAYGGWAVAASKNHHPDVALRALDARSKLAQESPATLFLRATSYDHLQQYDLAAETYHRFLAAANGGYPDQEWQARHRLIAIEPEGKKKK